MVPPVISLHKREYGMDPPLYIVRLAGTGAGEATEGETCRLVYRGETISSNATILSTRDVQFGELTQADAHLLLGSEASLRDLRLLLRTMYRMRPYWDEERTMLRILKISY